MSLDPQKFRSILSHYPTGVCVITAMTARGEAIGMTVGTFTSVSLDPLLIGFFPDRKSTSWSEIAAAGRFCVNILANDQEWLCRKFATRERDKFAEVVHRLSENGQPILDGAVAWIDCSLYAVHEAGDHYLVLGQVEAMALASERVASPLIFFQGKFGQVASIETPLA
ncbi:flavin reductase family protein [Nitrospirillum viridazoti]|uniref:Flavin reductase (DIM6/NTAB) family NADH-FMN oxidoreductase RutF n=1 Tax=Nitrospirillum amazonense TaxID=28077 RepID=A0A560HJY2_9PROT|nr:flavin reductase family protein [Nitrospirillum amazonense]TWB46807.1 flavin reductase (DIM6/NTAB) family NADH-FMN oxidoreductase RutF [Nitrospirillum amazonense]